MVGRLKAVLIWFVHTDTDELVSPRETSLPIYHRLKAARAGDDMGMDRRLIKNGSITDIRKQKVF